MKEKFRKLNQKFGEGVKILTDFKKLIKTNNSKLSFCGFNIYMNLKNLYISNISSELNLGDLTFP